MLNIFKAFITCTDSPFWRQPEKLHHIVLETSGFVHSEGLRLHLYTSHHSLYREGNAEKHQYIVTVNKTLVLHVYLSLTMLHLKFPKILHTNVIMHFSTIMTQSAFS